MRWTGGRRSRNVEDRRGRRIGRKTAGGGIGVIVIALIAMYFGVDPSVFLNQQGSPGVSAPSYQVSTSNADPAGNITKSSQIARQFKQNGSQPPFRHAGTAGGLFRRDLGPSCR